LHLKYRHVQEVIVQNFRAKPGTAMRRAPEPAEDEFLAAVAVARALFGARMNLQAPPNLSDPNYPRLISAGINDWGGISPVTIDHVNPEAPWPHLDLLRDRTAAAGKELVERLALYPAYTESLDRWVDRRLHAPVLHAIDSTGFARWDPWSPGSE